MRRCLGLKLFLTLSFVALLATIHVVRVPDAIAQAAYKLGKADWAGNLYSCQESATGSNLIGCEKCRTDNDCVRRGTGYACVSGKCRECSSDSHCNKMYSNSQYKCATNKVCAWEECSSNSVCTSKYSSQLHSCVETNGIGKCEITCNYSKLVSANRFYINLNGSRYLAHTAVNYMNQGFHSRNFLTYRLNMTYRNFTSMNTCKNGAMASCPNVWNNTSANRYNSLCLPCVKQSGGKWGTGKVYSAIGTTNTGNRPYYIRLTNQKVGGDENTFGSSLGFSGFGAFYPDFTGCCDYQVMNTSKNVAQRLRNCIFAAGDPATGEFLTNYQNIFGSSRVLKVDMYSPECALNGTGYRMVTIAEDSEYTYCRANENCVLSSGAWGKVYLNYVSASASHSIKKWFEKAFSSKRVGVSGYNKMGCGTIYLQSNGVQDARHWEQKAW